MNYVPENSYSFSLVKSFCYHPSPIPSFIVKTCFSPAYGGIRCKKPSLSASVPYAPSCGSTNLLASTMRCHLSRHWSNQDRHRKQASRSCKGLAQYCHDPRPCLHNHIKGPSFVHSSPRSYDFFAYNEKICSPTFCIRSLSQYSFIYMIVLGPLFSTMMHSRPTSTHASLRTSSVTANYCFYSRARIYSRATSFYKAFP